MEKFFKYYCGTCQRKKRTSLFYDKSEHTFDKHKEKKQQIQEFPKEVNNYVVLAHIGSGGCGNVFKVYEKGKENITYALKICSDLDLKSEILINKDLNHPNLIKF